MNAGLPVGRPLILSSLYLFPLFKQRRLYLRYGLGVPRGRTSLSLLLLVWIVVKILSFTFLPRYKGQSITATIYKFFDPSKSVMLCPKPTTFTKDLKPPNTSNIYRKSPNRSHELSVTAQRVEHLRIKIVVEGCEIVAQMLYPYKLQIRNFFLLPFNFFLISSQHHQSNFRVQSISAHKLDRHRQNFGIFCFPTVPR